MLSEAVSLLRFPEEKQPSYSSKGEMVSSNLMPLGVRKLPVAINTTNDGE